MKIEDKKRNLATIKNRLIKVGFPTINLNLFGFIEIKGEKLS